MLGETIKNLREKNGLTQLELSFLFQKRYKASVSCNTISRWETNTTTPTAKNLQRVSEIFGVDIAGLLNSLDQKPKEPPIKKPKDNNIIVVTVTLDTGEKVNYEITVSKIRKISENDGSREENGKNEGN